MWEENSHITVFYSQYLFFLEKGELLPSLLLITFTVHLSSTQTLSFKDQPVIKARPSAAGPHHMSWDHDIKCTSFKSKPAGGELPWQQPGGVQVFSLRWVYLLSTEVMGTFDQQPHTVDGDDAHTQQTDRSELREETSEDSLIYLLTVTTSDWRYDKDRINATGSQTLQDTKLKTLEFNGSQTKWLIN